MTIDYQALVSHLPVALLVMKGRDLHYVSPQFIELFAYSQSMGAIDDCRASSILNTIASADIDQAQTYDWRLDSNRRYRFMVYPLDKEGARLIYVEDRTTDWQAKFYKNMFECYIETMPHYVLWKDTELRFMGVNKRFAYSYGFQTTEDMLGLADKDMQTAKSHVSKYRQDDIEVCQTGQAKIGYDEIFDDGNPRRVRVNKLPVFVDSKVAGLFCVFDEINNAGNFMRAQDIKEVDMSSSAAMMNIQHDMRTPLAGVVGLADLLIQSEDIDKEYVYSIASDIAASAKKMLNYCECIIDFYKTESGRKLEEATAVQIGALVSELMDMQMPAAKVKGIHIETQITSDNYRVLLRRTSVLRVVGNLVTNSIKFSKENTTVNVTFSLEAINARTRTALLRIEVKDQGCGIKQEKLSALRYGDIQMETVKDDDAETGMGLKIVRLLVKNMKGKVSVNSAIGTGTHFKIFLPVKLLSSQF